MEDVALLLTEFVDFVKSKVDESLKKGEIKKVEINQDYFKWKIDRFEYSMDSGLASGATGQYITKTQTIYTHNLDTSLSNASEFKSLVDRLKEIYHTQDVQFKLQSFLRFIIQDYLDDKQVKQDLIDLFINELNDEPTRVKAFVRLQGVTVEDHPIKLLSSCTLRRITPADVEEEIPVHIPFFNVNNPIHNHVTAILEIEKDVLYPVDIQKEVEKAILTLRLFRVGGATSVSYSLSGKTITRFIGGTLSSGQKLIIPREKLKVYAKDTEKIKQFWKEFNSLNHSSLIGMNQTTNLENIQFAYQRYCDSLFSAGVFEQQVASAIIGLESLYLNDSEELSRFLRLRISKFLGLAGLNPHHIQDVLKDAYDVRSYFVHGNKIDYKKRRKIQNKYKTEKDFLKEVLEYLRLSIVILLTMHRPKDELIDLIDDSFIDRTKDETLGNQLKEIMKRFAMDADVK